jgi:hypothetical protein
MPKLIQMVPEIAKSIHLDSSTIRLYSMSMAKTWVPAWMPLHASQARDKTGLWFLSWIEPFRGVGKRTPSWPNPRPRERRGEAQARGLPHPGKRARVRLPEKDNKDKIGRCTEERLPVGQSRRAFVAMLGGIRYHTKSTR